MFLISQPDDHRWVLAVSRIRDRLLLRWRELDLDAQLAAGVPVETSRLLALRAAALVAPAGREELAGCWEKLVGEHGDGRRGPLDPRIPVQRWRVLDAVDEIRRMIVALRATGPVPARGVALVSRLLTDGAGPLYDPRSTVDLRAATAEAVEHLDPATRLLLSGPDL